MASYFEEERFFLGEKSNRMVIVAPFMGKLKVHIRQFYVNEKGEKEPGKNGIALELDEFEALAKLVPKVQDSIARYELKDTGIPSSSFKLDLPVLDLDTVFLPSLPSQESIPIIRKEELLDSQPNFPSSLPLLIEPSLEKYLSGLSPKEKLDICYQDLDTDEYLFGPSIDEQQVVFESQNSVSLPSLESIDENSPNKLKGKRKRSSEITRNVNKKTKTENRRNSGIFVGYAKLPSGTKEEQKKERKIFTKKECIDEVASVESMKEVERKLWLTHYDMLSEKLNEVVTEKCTGCQMSEPSLQAHEFCLLASVEEQVNTSFGEVYKRVIWDEVLDNTPFRK